MSIWRQLSRGLRALTNRRVAGPRIVTALRAEDERFANPGAYLIHAGHAGDRRSRFGLVGIYGVIS